MSTTTKPARKPGPVAKRIAQFRKELDLTQQEFSDKMGINQRTLSSLETGRTEPTLKHIASLIKMDCSSLWLFEGIRPMRISQRKLNQATVEVERGPNGVAFVVRPIPISSPKNRSTD